MPRLTRRQTTQLDSIEHYLRKVLAELSAQRTVVTMRSAGTTTTEFYNARSDSWVTPVRPNSLAYLEHAQRSIDTLRAESAPKERP